MVRGGGGGGGTPQQRQHYIRPIPLTVALGLKTYSCEKSSISNCSLSVRLWRMHLECQIYVKLDILCVLPFPVRMNKWTDCPNPSFLSQIAGNSESF